MSNANDRTKDRDVMALAFLREAGSSSVVVVTAHLLFEGSFAGSRSPNSRESATRASLDRLIEAGQVERDTTSKPYRYAAKAAEDPRMYHSKLTRAEFDAIIAIEEVMEREECEGMFPGDHGDLPEALADSMEADGWLESQWMEPHEDYTGDSPDGGAAYWPTANGRFLRGMCVGAELRGREVIFAETSTVSSAIMVARELAKNWGPLPMWLDADQREALFAWVRRQAEEPGGDIVATIGARLRLPEPAAIALCSAALAPAPTEPGPW